MKKLKMNGTTGSWAYGEKAPMPREEQTKVKEIRDSSIHCGLRSIPRDAIVAAKRLWLFEEIADTSGD
ncbi:hypothetical protein [Bradyrhizobium sp. sGM-13]|uniref:hypothetical protein n=1 Tax=Bradyrhizobium sp. sGM-13 TaxID=2831781 RepID=UPI001BCF1673|nr:hypothetical protein [Bradyrhizobium sp. sGM-13]